MNKPLFELHGPDGSLWRLYADGRYEGFPEGTWIVNMAAILIQALEGRIAQLEHAGQGDY